MNNNQENLKTEQGDLYGLEFNVKVPCEIRVNDLILSKNLITGVIGPEVINQYLINSGKQKVSIKITHPYNDGLFDSNGLQSILDGTFIQSIQPHNDYKVDVIKELKFPTIEDKVHSFEYEWDFEVKTPYTISRWDDAQDLSKINQDILYKEVFDKYQELWNFLEAGEVKKFTNEISMANNELFLSNYYTKSKIEEYKTNLITFYSNHKGKMVPIQNSKMVILGNGRGVALEQTRQFKGFGLLTANGETENSLYTNYITLIKSKKTNKFEVILINSEFIKYK